MRAASMGTPNAAAPGTGGHGTLLQVFVEGSNVNAAEQMVAMISLARQFEMQVRMLQNADANDRAQLRRAAE